MRKWQQVQKQESFHPALHFWHSLINNLEFHFQHFSGRKCEAILDHWRQFYVKQKLWFLVLRFVLTRGFVVVDLDSFQLIGIVALVSTGRTDPMLIRDHLPELKKNNCLWVSIDIKCFDFWLPYYRFDFRIDRLEYEQFPSCFLGCFWVCICM